MSPQVGCLGGADLGIEGGEGGEVAVSPREAEQLYRHLLSSTNDLRFFFASNLRGYVTKFAPHKALKSIA